MIENYAEKIKHESNGFIRHNGIRIVSVDEEKSVLEAEITDNSRNVWGSVHGGFLYTMADTAAGAFARIKYGRRNVTLNGSMNYLRPTTHSKTLTAVGREIKVRSLLIGNLKFCFFLFSDQLLHFFRNLGILDHGICKWCFIFFLDPYHLTSAQHKKKHCQTQQRSCFFHKFSHFPVLDFFSMYSMQSIKHLLQVFAKSLILVPESCYAGHLFDRKRNSL